MWSRQASLDLSGIALGVGHFTVPPDAIAEHPGHAPGVSEFSSSVRTMVVPHGIVAVPRRSPIKARKRTPWNPSADRQRVIERGGSREWFADRLFVESKPAHLPAACSTSVIVHAAVVVIVLLVMAATAASSGLARVAPPRPASKMPPMVWLMPAVVAPPPPPSLVPATTRPAPPPIEAAAAAPLEAPSTIEPEPAMRDDAREEPALAPEADGAANGVDGGLAGGTGEGPLVQAAPPEDAAPLRVGNGVERPRKIKDVKPVYPLPAMVAQVGGNVYIEATIGADGKVHNARVIRSVAILDQAALDAVRQWEFEPSRRNGVAVAVTMIIVVTFAIL